MTGLPRPFKYGSMCDNLISRGQLDKKPGDLAMYSYDARGPSCFEEGNNVVVEPVGILERDVVEQYRYLNRPN